MPRLHQLTALLALLAVAPACDVEVLDPELESSTAENIGEIDEGADSAGADDGEAGALLLGCGLEPACDAIDLSDAGSPAAAYSGDGLCLLSALAAGQPGLVQTVMTFDSSIANLDFALTGDGAVLRQSYGDSEGVGEWINPPMRCELKGRAFFETCQLQFDPSCLDPEAWVVACEPIDGAICPETAADGPA
ncbi:MAG: hypothetical protein KC486_11980 [Myxococcales bacterium]|nr:hypothetical protein [Myxococcales bacterium]